MTSLLCFCPVYHKLSPKIAEKTKPRTKSHLRVFSSRFVSGIEDNWTSLHMHINIISLLILNVGLPGMKEQWIKQKQLNQARKKVEFIAIFSFNKCSRMVENQNRTAQWHQTKLLDRKEWI